MSEVTPIVDDQEMLRAYAETIKLKDAEIEQLRTVVEDLSDHGVAAERMERLKAQGKEIKRLKVEFQKAKEWNQLSEIQIKNLQNIVEVQSGLLLRAADAIEEVAGYTSGDPDIYRYLRLKEQQLIAELRKAAE